MYSANMVSVSFKCVYVVIELPFAIAKAALSVGTVHLLVSLSVCLSPKCVDKNAIFSKTRPTQFRAVVSIDDL